MEKPIRKIGNSQGIIIPKMILESIGVNIGDLMKAHVKDGKIILEPTGIK
jgi:antitoxin component of MazEF toxin-antitoxin module